MGQEASSRQQVIKYVTWPLACPSNEEAKSLIAVQPCMVSDSAMHGFETTASLSQSF